MKTLEQLKASQVFHRAMTSRGIVDEKHDEIAKVMFALSRMILANVYAPPKSLTPEALYQKLCLERYNYFKDRLEGEKVQLERGVEVLKAMAEEKRF